MTAPSLTQPSEGDDLQQQISAARQQFVTSALNMSWQLAIVVLLPFVGGYKLDQHFHSNPVLTLLGFGVAMLGVAAVLWRQLQLLSPDPRTQSHKRGKNS